MDFVALISGGKDSLFSIMEAVAHGYRLRVVVHLAPKMSKYGTEEQDSYMYQSVASEGVKCLADALNVPLISIQVTGGITYKETDYIVHQSDEVEDLYGALSQAKTQVPSLRFVSSGAILSDYQRIRVENVAARLGLCSLAFLWRRSQDLLLDDMINADLDAIIVKVASFGLRADRHLGQHLRDIRPQLLQLAKSPCQLNICGEGGEYETFTLDCPLFEQQICLQSTPEVVIHAEDEFYPVVYLRLTDICLQPKAPSKVCRTPEDLLTMKWRSDCEVKDTNAYRRPFLAPTERLINLDGLVRDEIAQDFLFISDSSEYSKTLDAGTSNGTLHPLLVPKRLGSVIQGRLWITEMCVGACAIRDELNWAVREATREAITKLRNIFTSLDSSGDQVVHCWAVLNQSLTPIVFDAFNAIYVSEFGMPWELPSVMAASHANRVFPPTRACVVVDPLVTADGTLYQSEHVVVVGLIAVVCPLSESGNRPVLTGGYRVQGMHVRSLSHWAPANIGPYSQAISIRLTTHKEDESADAEVNGETVVGFYSGQIGLIPETLALVSRLDTEPDVRGQSLLALRHCHRVMKVQSSCVWRNLSVAICFGTSSGALDEARQTFHQTVCCSWFPEDTSSGSLSDSTDDGSCACKRRAIFVHVTDLPKHACVEWQCITASIAHLPSPIAYSAELSSLCSPKQRRSASLLFACHEAPLSDIPLGCPIVPCCGFLDRTEPFAALYL